MEVNVCKRKKGRTDGKEIPIKKKSTSFDRKKKKEGSLRANISPKVSPRVATGVGSDTKQVCKGGKKL